jgi:chromosome segregation ATPase
MRKIRTGADGLIELIQEAKRISLDDAAKALGVGKDLVQEWGEFFEKEKLISIDYSFSKVFFTERKLSSSEVRSSAKEFVFEKDAFLRKVDYALASLEKESVNFTQIKEKFNSIHGEVKDEIKIVERELGQLEKYNELKISIDKEIEYQKKKYAQDVESIKKDIKKQESGYVDLYTKIVKEKEGIAAHKNRLLALEKSQKDITDSIKSANAVLVKLKEDLSFEESEMNKKLKSLDKLSKEFENFSNDVIKEKEKKIGNLTNSLNKESAKLDARQDELLKEARMKAAKLQGFGDLGKKIKGSFDGFFSKTLIISKKIDEIDKEKTNLKDALLVIAKKAKALSLMNSNNTLKKQAQEIAVEIKKQEEAKKNLLGKMKSLLNDLKM